MKKIILSVLIFFFLKNIAIAENELSLVDNLFHIDQMNSHNKNFALYFKVREKAILARGEESNYINDFPKDLYITLCVLFVLWSILTGIYANIVMNKQIKEA